MSGRLVGEVVEWLQSPAADYEYRLGELAHLVDGGVPLDEAARRVGIAYGTARRYLHDLQTGKETA